MEGAVAYEQRAIYNLPIIIRTPRVGRNHRHKSLSSDREHVGIVSVFGSSSLESVVDGENYLAALTGGDAKWS
jgi:hypothetical protein